MSISVPIERTPPTTAASPPSSETRDEKIARYGSAEFTQQLTEAFHRAKQLGIQADRDAARRT